MSPHAILDAKIGQTRMSLSVIDKCECNILIKKEQNLVWPYVCQSLPL